MISYAMTAQTNLQLHRERHEYKRGRYKGDAPADASRRARTHFRVTPDHTVTFHTTNILTARPDGTIRLHTNGWHNSTTTREAMDHALYVATKKRGFYLRSQRYNGLSQTAIGPHRYYDGMVFDSDMQLVSSPAPFSAYATDREATKALRDAAAPLRAMLPILVAAEGANPTSGHANLLWWSIPGRTDTDRAMYIFDNPEHWPAFVSYFYNHGDTHQTLWARAYARLTINMRKVVDV